MSGAYFLNRDDLGEIKKLEDELRACAAVEGFLMLLLGGMLMLLLQGFIIMFLGLAGIADIVVACDGHIVETQGNET